MFLKIRNCIDNAKDAASKVADKTTDKPENAAGTLYYSIDNYVPPKILTGQDVAAPARKMPKAESDLNKDDAKNHQPC